MTDAAQNTTEPRTLFEIPEANYGKFEREIAKLSKRSEKLIGSPIKPFVFGYDFKDIGGDTIKVFNVMLTAETPKIDGWTFLARIDHSQEVGNIIRAVPNTGVEVPATYRTAKPHCDHCKVLRYRRDTFVLHNDETNEFKQVGTSCLTDFFGHDPSAIAKAAELLGYAVDAARANAEYDETTAGGLVDRRYLETEVVLAHAALNIRRNGGRFISATAARNDHSLTSTATLVHATMHAARTLPADRPTDEDRAVAAAAVEWAQGFCENDNLSDYMHNVCVVARSPYIEHRALGLAVSIVGVYLREQEKAKPRQQVDLGDLSGILALFDKAKEKLKNPAIVLDTTDANGNDTTVRLSVAGPQAKFPGSINVTSEGSFQNRDWYGRVKLDGALDARPNAPAGLTATLTAFAADPAGVAAAHGRKTGNCCFCNKALNDARSTEVGYGPVCAKNFGLAWGGKGGDDTPRGGEPVEAATEATDAVEATEAPVVAEAPAPAPAASVNVHDAVIQWTVTASLPRDTVVLGLTADDALIIEEALRYVGGDALAAWKRRGELA